MQFYWNTKCGFLFWEVLSLIAGCDFTETPDTWVALGLIAGCDFTQKLQIYFLCNIFV